MGKKRNHHKSKSHKRQGKRKKREKAIKINASTPYELGKDRMSAFGGAFTLVKFFELVEFKQLFKEIFLLPRRIPRQGCYFMVYGMILLLFIGFCRLGHFFYIQSDSFLCGIFGVEQLPSHTTYWRFLNSLTINQARSLQKLIHALRERVWLLCDLTFQTIHIDIDTTVETIYGNIEGAFKGHNTKNRGKKGLRPILAFINETNECLAGKLRKGKTISSEEFCAFLLTLPQGIPKCVKKVILRADGEFISGKACDIAIKLGYSFIFGNKRCDPPFDKKSWYQGVHIMKNKKVQAEYNSIEYQPHGWTKKYRFVAMRFLKDSENSNDCNQLKLFEKENYVYRIFATNLKGRPHKIIQKYDFRAGAENLVGECKREGLAAIPSKKFKNNYNFFQIVLLSFNIWRYLKFFVAKSDLKNKKEKLSSEKIAQQTQIIDHPIVKNTARIARLKLLFISAKIINHEQTKVKYSFHDTRVPELINLFNELDDLRKKKKPWRYPDPWNRLQKAA